MTDGGEEAYDKGNLRLIKGGKKDSTIVRVRALEDFSIGSVKPNHPSSRRPHLVTPPKNKA